MSTKLYVGSLPFSVTNDELNQVFAVHGNVVSARVITDKISGRSKGFGFVEYDNEDAARKAIETLNNSDLNGRKIVVSEAHPQREGGGGGGRGGPRRFDGPRGGGRGGFGGRDRGHRGGGGYGNH